MAQLSVLLERIYEEMPSVPEDMALRALSDAAKEFCARTHAWQVELPRMRVRVGTAAYELQPDDGTQIVALKDVRLDDRKMQALPTESTRLRDALARPGMPTHFSQWGPDTIVLNRQPVADGALVALVALTLALGSTVVDMPDVLLDEYGEPIAMGAKMRLARMKSQPWHSPESVVSYASLYYNAINTAKGRAASALGEADMRIEMRSW